MAEYKISNIYQGGYSSLKPSYGDLFTGYHVSANSLSTTTLPNTANVLKEFGDKLNMGIKNVEVTAINPQTFDEIPKQHLKEINRLSKLTGVDVSLHGILAEPSGMTQEGYNEAHRKAIERQIQQNLERGHELKPDGNINVTFHTSNMFPSADVSVVKDPKTGEMKEKVGSFLIVNTETGRPQKLPLIERSFPGDDKEPSIQQEIERINDETWNSRLSHLSFNVERGNHAIQTTIGNVKSFNAEKAAGKKIPEELERVYEEFNYGVLFLNDSYRELKELYNDASKRAKGDDLKKLDDFKKKIESDALLIQKDPKSDETIEMKQKIIKEGIALFKDIKTPEIYAPLDDFMRDKTATTFGNAAFNAYKKYGNSAPIVSIENPPASQQFSRAEDVKQIVEKSREQFVAQAKKEGMSEGEAKKAAEKLIGATWDVGHINMIRKFGYSEKDVVKEAEKIAPYLKHVHLSDNFGMEHSELPMGMGNVPLKDIMKKLGQKGFEAKKVIEAAAWWTHFGQQGRIPPFSASLEGMGAPMYSAGGPYWNQALGLQQGYFGGYGRFLPTINYESFGGGFSQLPAELGGQKQTAQGSRMSGRGME